MPCYFCSYSVTCQTSFQASPSKSFPKVEEVDRFSFYVRDENESHGQFPFLTWTRRKKKKAQVKQQNSLQLLE